MLDFNLQPQDSKSTHLHTELSIYLYAVTLCIFTFLFLALDLKSYRKPLLDLNLQPQDSKAVHVRPELPAGAFILSMILYCFFPFSGISRLKALHHTKTQRDYCRSNNALVIEKVTECKSQHVKNKTEHQKMKSPQNSLRLKFI